MKLTAHGTGTSEAEVTNVDSFGVWLLVRDHEYFLPYQEYPWFREARIRDILNVRLLHGDHLHWPKLDVDLCIASLKHPEGFPLTYQAEPAIHRRRRQRIRRHAERSDD